MAKTKKKRVNLARVIYDSYPGSDLLPIEPDKDCRNMAALTSDTYGSTDLAPPGRRRAA